MANALPSLPTRTPFLDGSGRISKPWLDYLQKNTAATTPPIAIYVIGALAIESDAAPNPYITQAANPSRLSAYVKQAPTGADLTFTINAGGVDWATVTIPAGSTSVTVSNPGSITANTPIRLNIKSVGTTYPGSDLAVFLYF